MALQIKNEFIIEDIVDENNKKIGELKFNPKDSRIMKILTEAVLECSNALKEIDKLGNIKNLSTNDLKTIEDFEKESELFEKIDKAFGIELTTFEKVIENLSNVFGKETIELFTQGTKDIDCLMPIINFVGPYVKKERKKIIDKYKKVNSQNSKVME